jgi:uncharacterized protein YndB with AHSA1/START domain
VRGDEIKYSKKIKMKKTGGIYLFIFFTLTSFCQAVKNTSYKNEAGEKVLRLETILPMGISASWQLFTTDQKLKTWLAPVVHIELKTGGYIVTNYDSTKKLTDKSSIHSRIINFITNEMLILKVNLNDNFPKSAIAADSNLQHIIQLFEIDSQHTKIISSMVGFGNGSDWDKTYDFFLKGNTWTFGELLNLCNKK